MEALHDRVHLIANRRSQDRIIRVERLLRYCPAGEVIGAQRLGGGSECSESRESSFRAKYRARR